MSFRHEQSEVPVIMLYRKGAYASCTQEHGVFARFRRND